MNDMSGNKYISERRSSLSLYSFLFDDKASPKYGGDGDIASSVYGLLSLLHFGSYCSGYRYFAKLVTRYIKDRDYDRRTAINSISEECGVSEQAVSANIAECIRLNDRFTDRAALLLKMPIEKTTDIDEAVEILGALYTKYCAFISDGQ